MQSFSYEKQEVCSCPLLVFSLSNLPFSSFFYEPGPVSGIFLLKGFFFSWPCCLFRGQPLGFCRASKDNWDYNIITELSVFICSRWVNISPIEHVTFYVEISAIGFWKGMKREDYVTQGFKSIRYWKIEKKMTQSLIKGHCICTATCSVLQLKIMTPFGVAYRNKDSTSKCTDESGRKVCEAASVVPGGYIKYSDLQMLSTH